MTSAEELRAAAAQMRELAEAVITGTDELPGMHWFADHATFEGGRSEVVALDEGSLVAQGLHREMAEHFAAWDPAVALAVADWLESVVNDEAFTAMSSAYSCVCFNHALAVARVFLGGTA